MLDPVTQKKKKGQGNLTDTKNKTHQKKNKGPDNLTDTENKTQQKKKKKQRSVLARAVPEQTCNFNI
jgi:hypothetical protein